MKLKEIVDHLPVILRYKLVKTTNRLTFDITSHQHQDYSTIYQGEDDGPYLKFIASNGYEVISRSRMDIQTERLWLLGAKYLTDPRSGTMVFSSDQRRDAAYDQFIIAINEWAAYNNGIAIDDTERKAKGLQAKIDALMLEYCPDEMTKEQLDEWGSRQEPASIDFSNLTLEVS